MNNLKKFLVKSLIFVSSSLIISWSDVKVISNTGMNYGPSVSVNGSNAAIAWITNLEENSNIQFSYYNGSGETPFVYNSDNWTSPVVLNELNVGFNVEPMIKMNGYGDIVVIWGQIDYPNRFVVCSVKPFGGNWETPIIISSTGTNVFANIAIDDYRHIIASWINQDTNQIFVKTRTVESEWSSTQTLYESATAIGALTIGMDETGNSNVIWEDYDTHMIYASQTNDGFESTWSEPTIISDSGFNIDPVLSVNSNGNAIASWTDINQYHILASTYENGYWNSPVVISETNCYFPAVTTIDQDYTISYFNMDTGNIEYTESVSGVWTTPIELTTNSASNLPMATSNQYETFVVTTDLTTGLIKAIICPKNGVPATPVSISDDIINEIPQLNASDAMTVVVWEANLGSEIQIQVNVN